MDHDHSHGHDHVHGHHHGHAGHVHAPATFGRVFAIGIALNIGIVVLQTVYGVIAESVALLADAAHNLSDVLGLVVAWIGFALARRPPTRRFSYGLKGSTVLAALFNAVFLLVAVGALSWEAVQRFFDPRPIATGTVMAVAAIGMILNAATAWLFASGRKDDINIKGAFLHMAADAGVSAGVIIGAALIALTGWLWLDPALSLLINAVIVWGTWGLLKESVALSLAAAPARIDPDKVTAFLASRPGVAEVHDLHVWPIGTRDLALTAHLVIPAGHPGDAALRAISHDLEHEFGIGHATLQVEQDGASCPLAPAHVV